MKMKQSGFSLLELLISAAIALILLAGLLQAIHAGILCCDKILTALELQQNARVGLLRVMEDLRMARSIYLVKDNRIWFIDYRDGQKVSFYCDYKNQLIRYKNNAAVPVASYIKSIKFVQKDNTVYIFLSAKNGGQKLNLNNKINLTYYRKNDIYNTK